MVPAGTCSEGFDEARTKLKAFRALLDCSAVDALVDTMRAKRLSVRAECCLCSTRVLAGDLPSDAFSFALQIQTVHVAS